MNNDLVIDATGLRCPLPVIRLAAVARSAPAGSVITLLSTDPAAEPDVAAWCRMRGHELLDQEWLDSRTTLRSRIRVRSGRSGAVGGPAGPRPAAGGIRSD